MAGQATKSPDAISAENLAKAKAHPRFADAVKVIEGKGYTNAQAQKIVGDAGVENVLANTSSFPDASVPAKAPVKTISSLPLETETLVDAFLRIYGENKWVHVTAELENRLQSELDGDIGRRRRNNGKSKLMISRATDPDLRNQGQSRQPVAPSAGRYIRLVDEQTKDAEEHNTAQVPSLPAA